MPNTPIPFQGCICGQVLAENEVDRYSLQVRKFGVESPEMIWAHGPCLRRVIPVVGMEIPNTLSHLDPRQLQRHDLPPAVALHNYIHLHIA